MPRRPPAETGRTRFPVVRTPGSPRRRWPVGVVPPNPGQAVPTDCRMTTCPNVRDVTLSSPGEHIERALDPVRLTRSADTVQRWRWDLTPRRGCPLTRCRGVRPRPLGASTVGELT